MLDRGAEVRQERLVGTAGILEGVGEDAKLLAGRLWPQVRGDLPDGAVLPRQPFGRQFHRMGWLGAAGLLGRPGGDRAGEQSTFMRASSSGSMEWPTRDAAAALEESLPGPSPVSTVPTRRASKTPLHDDPGEDVLDRVPPHADAEEGLTPHTEE